MDHFSVDDAGVLSYHGDFVADIWRDSQGVLLELDKFAVQHIPPKDDAVAVLDELHTNANIHSAITGKHCVSVEVAAPKHFRVITPNGRVRYTLFADFCVVSGMDAPLAVVKKGNKMAIMGSVIIYDFWEAVAVLKGEMVVTRAVLTSKDKIIIINRLVRLVLVALLLILVWVR